MNLDYLYGRTVLPIRRLACALFILTAFLSCMGAAFAQSAGTGTISGRVFNKTTGEYLRSAVVTVAGTDISTQTESGGRFTLSGVPAGEVRITASYAGLDASPTTVTVQAGGIATADVVLTSAGHADDTVKMSQFVVTSEREGNAKAIQEQKVAENMKSVVATDAYGTVSEGNVGEFLKLMPGVAMDYVEADVRTIRIRGMDPKYAVVLMDGAPIASAGSSSVGTGRAFEFEQLSISSIETIEMSKTPTPADNASAMAGVVNLRSKGAFDRKGRRIAWAAGLAMNEYYADFSRTAGIDDGDSYKIVPNGSLEYSDVYLNGKLGVIMGGLFSRSLTAQKHFRVNTSGQGAYTWNSDPTDNATEQPKFAALNYRDGPKLTDRTNYNIRLDYRFSDELWAWARLDYNKYDASFFNRDINLSFTTLDPAANNTPTSYTTLPAGGNVSIFTGFNNKFGDTRTLTSAINYKHQGLTADGLVQYSRATNYYADITKGFFSGVAASLTGIPLQYSRSSVDSGTITVTQPGATAAQDWRNLDNYTLNTSTTTVGLGSTPRSSKDQKYTGKLDFRYETKLGVPMTLRWGGAYNGSYRDIDRGSDTYRYLGADKIAGTADDTKIGKAYFENRYPLDFGFDGNINGLYAPSAFIFADELHKYPERFTTDPVANLQQFLFGAQGNSEFKEDISAGYFQDVLKFGKFDIAPGVRFEKTDGWGIGRNDIGDAAARRKLGMPATGGSTNTVDYVVARYGTRRTAGNSYHNWFKYLHSNYRATKDLIFRASYHESITRGDIGNLIPGVTAVDETAQRVTTANPDLKPETSRNLNAGVEYYFKQVGMIGLSVFRSDIKNLQRTIDEPLDETGLNGDVSYAGWIARHAENIAKSHRSGLEANYTQQLTFLPKPLDGFSVFANYTLLTYDVWDFYNLSPKRMANGGVTYQKGWFGGSIRGNWTDRKLQTAGTYNLQTNTYTPPANGIRQYESSRLMFDVEFNFRLARNISLNLTGRNVFNEPLVYYQVDKRWVTRRAYFGALWTANIRGTF